MIYIATKENGKSSLWIGEFSSKAEFLTYAKKWLAIYGYDSSMLNGRPNIDTICEALADNGPGFGSRHHYRVFKKDIKCE